MKRITHLWLLIICLIGLCSEIALGQCGTYTTSGTFIVPPGVTSIVVECWGGGGGGGNSIANNSSGGGGGGGYASKTISVTAGQTFTYTVGNGGAANTDGEDSWFGTSTTVLAKGGKKGAQGTTAASGGNGGCSAGDCIGDVTRNGGKGGIGRGSGTGGGGGGGGAGSSGDGANGNLTASAGGAGGSGNLNGKGADGRTGSNGTNTNTANGYGGGGGGTRGAGNGSAGAGGAVKITCIYTVDNFTIETVVTNPSPLCLDQSGQVIIEVKNNSGANVGSGTSDYKIDYSWDNSTWTNNVNEVNSILNGGTQNYSFNVIVNTIGPRTIYIRIRKNSDGSIITVKTVTIYAVNCNPSANPDCTNATPITTNSTYVGNTGSFPNVGGGHWLNGVVSGSTVENIAYYQFVASNSMLHFTVCQPTCGALSGIQIYLFKTCGNQSSNVLSVRQICSSCGSLSYSQGPYTVSYTNNGGGCYSFTIGGLTVGDTYYWGVDGFEGASCDYSISFTSGVVLSVELTSFDGFPVQNGNQLKWQTDAEINNDYFELEATTDGINYRKVGRIKGAGTSNEQQNYELLDPTFDQITYYRLKQTNFDGTHTYLPIIMVNRGSNKDVMISPNPVANIMSVDLYIHQEGNYSFSFINTLGASVEKNFLLSKGENHVEIDLSEQLATGFYILRISDENEIIIHTSRFIKE